MQTPPALRSGNSSPPINRMLFSSMKSAFVSDDEYSKELHEFSAYAPTLEESEVDLQKAYILAATKHNTMFNSGPRLPPAVRRIPLSANAPPFVVRSAIPIPRSPFARS